MRRPVVVTCCTALAVAPILVGGALAGGALAAPERGPLLWTVTIVTERGTSVGAARSSPTSSRPAPPRRTAPDGRAAVRGTPVSTGRAVRPTRQQGGGTVTVTGSPTTASATPRKAPGAPSAAPTAVRSIAVPTQQAPPSPTIATLTIRHVSLDGASTSYEFVPVTVTPR